MNHIETPESWNLTPLEELVSFALGGDWGKDLDHDDPEYSEVRCIRGSELRSWPEEKGRTSARRKIKKTSLEKRKLQEGDLLIEISGGGPDQPVGRAVMVDAQVLRQFSEIPAVCTNFFRMLRLVKGILPSFLTLYLQHFYIVGGISAYQAGSNNLRNLKFNDYLQIKIPIAPLEEQERIVTKVETLFSELDKGIEALKTARAQLKVYRQAVLKHAFEGKLTARWRAENPDKLETSAKLLEHIQQQRKARYQQQLHDWTAAVEKWEAAQSEGKRPSKPSKPDQSISAAPNTLEIPSEWAAISLGDLNAEVFDGPFGSNLKSSDYVEAGVRVIRLENIGHLEFIGDKYSFVTEEKYSTLEKHTVRGGDLVFSSFITEGIRVAVLPETIDKAINKADCFCVRLHGDTYRNDFLASYLSTRGAYKHIEEEIHGIGRPRINTTQLKGFVVPVCSRAEQDEIMRQIEQRLSVAEHMNADISAELTRIELFKQSILKKAFSGQLVPQNLDEEPASALLNRINSTKAVHQNYVGKSTNK